MTPEVSEGSCSRRGGGSSGLGGVFKGAEHKLGALVPRRDDGDEHNDRHSRDQLVRAGEGHEAGDAVRGHHVDEAVQDQAHCRGAESSHQHNLRLSHGKTAVTSAQSPSQP